MKAEPQNEWRGPANIVNDLTGKEWILFSKSWFSLNPAKRDFKLLHPASFPEEIPQSFIGFFTMKGQWVLDPFAGTGSTMLASRRLGRNFIGIELYSRYAKIAGERSRIEKYQNETRGVMVVGDSRRLKEIFETLVLPNVSLCVTSPPYWNQLQSNHRRQQPRAEKGLSTSYGASEDDLGNLSDYHEFLRQQEKVFDSVYEVTKPGGYLVVVTNNVYKEKRLWPLAFDTFNQLSKRWEPKDEKIWVQDNKPLYPFGIFRAWVANRSHHYCLIMRKPN